MMTDTITIRKGLDIPVSGAAERRLTDARNIAMYAVKPTDFVGLTPHLLVEEGDTVAVGDVLFCDKHDERICFTSPVAGRVIFQGFPSGRHEHIFAFVQVKLEYLLESIKHMPHLIRGMPLNNATPIFR